MEFQFATASRIIFGPGSACHLAPLAASFGRRALVVVGSVPERHSSLLESLEATGVATCLYSVIGEPTVELIERGVETTRSHECALVVSIGGGSAIDAGKAIAGLASNPGEPLDYLEIIGKGEVLSEDPLPFLAVPTTAGTGAEVTRNAVLGSPQHGVKVSFRDYRLLPDVAIIDPELTLTMPSDVTAFSGMDALTQVLEPLVSSKATPFTDLLCRDGIRRASQFLYKAYAEPLDLEARLNMSMTSLYGGLALANAGLGAVHGIAGPVGGMIRAPHGIICAALLPHVMEVNIAILKESEGGSSALARYREVAVLLTGNQGAQPEDGTRRILELCHRLQIPTLSEFDLQDETLQDAARKSLNSSSMKGNPTTLSLETVCEVLRKAL
ncbi:MAG: iron-containing alcohol dehydrogenase [Candidatus Bathyarchaeota archaeon]|nr:iron-containing alcohol dehydrogenase [Candidatus Bathyarchaeota archaeon]